MPRNGPIHNMLLCTVLTDHNILWFGVDSARAGAVQYGDRLRPGRPPREPIRSGQGPARRRAAAAPRVAASDDGAATPEPAGRAHRPRLAGREEHSDGGAGGPPRARPGARRRGKGPGRRAVGPEEEQAQHGSSRTRRRPGRPAGRQARQGPAASTPEPARPAQARAGRPAAPRPIAARTDAAFAEAAALRARADDAAAAAMDALRFTGRGDPRPHVRAALDAPRRPSLRRDRLGGPDRGHRQRVRQARLRAEGRRGPGVLEPARHQRRRQQVLPRPPQHARSGRPASAS